VRRLPAVVRVPQGWLAVPRRLRLTVDVHLGPDLPGIVLVTWATVVEERLRFYTDWSDAESDGRTYWVGPAPRLATPDADTSYAAEVTSIVPAQRIAAGYDLRKATVHVQYRTV